MADTGLLDECIEEYRTLKSLKGLTEQQRGQKFNALIAKVLNAHQIHAISDHRSKGEIDVCFRITDKRFILEAKWEDSKINMDPIAKLGLRINQRIPNNLGVILSMSGYTREALKQMNQVGRPNILLIEQDIFEALLYDNIDAGILFDACVDVAAFEGKMHVSLSDVFKYMPRKTLPISISPEIEDVSDRDLISQLKPTGNLQDYKIIKTDLPFGQTGVSISGEFSFITLVDGLYQLDQSRFTNIFRIDNPQNRCIFDDVENMMFFVKNNSVMAVDRKGNPHPISKRYPGHVRLFKDNGVIQLVSNGDDFSHPKQPVRIIADIVGRKEEMVFDYPISCCTDACCIDDNKYAIVGSSGLIFYENMNRVWSVDVLNGASVSYLNNKIYFLENGVSLKSIGLDGGDITPICEFNLSGSVGDFAIINENEYIFHLCYSSENKTKTAIVYVAAA